MNKKITLSLPEDLVDFIKASTTERKQGEFVAVLLRQAMRQEKDGDGALERLALAVERATQVMERGGKQ